MDDVRCLLFLVIRGGLAGSNPLKGDEKKYAPPGGYAHPAGDSNVVFVQEEDVAPLGTVSTRLKRFERVELGASK